MVEDWCKEWAASKVAIATRLSAGECGGGYAEAVTILCNVLSAIAAERWPGKQKDKKRFVELLHTCADPDLHPTRVSVPLLAAHLEADGRRRDANGLRKAFIPYSDTRVVTGDDVDKSEQQVTEVCPDLTPALVRQFSYAAVLYVETRSSYVHEYAAGSRSDSWGMGSTHAMGCVSYTNRLDVKAGKVDRLIYFDVGWLTDVVLSVVNNIRAVPGEQFTNWWLPDSPR